MTSETAPRVRQPGPMPDHGDARRYRRGCICRRCTSAATAEAKKWKFHRDNGRSGFVPAEQVIRHVWRLRYAGVTDAEIREMARLAPPHLYQIIRTQAPVRHSTAARIFAIPVPDASAAPTRNGAFIPSLGTIRRLQALTAEGWPARELEKRLRVGTGYVAYLLRESGDTVRLFTAAAIRSLYGELEGLSPEAQGVPRSAAQAARNRASKKGWPTAAYWDADDFDNPAFLPATGSTPRYIELAENGLELERVEGYTRQQAADRLGVSKDALQQAISRYRASQGQVAA
ncbi:hypothetical protein MIU24_32555 [Streptomyces venezuelae]|uniref:hypothetical protein n=1 Tax=Streptomyces sp. B6(2022) TaxID=3404749 RepID=UPI00311FE8EF